MDARALVREVLWRRHIEQRRQPGNESALTEVVLVADIVAQQVHYQMQTVLHDDFTVTSAFLLHNLQCSIKHVFKRDNFLDILVRRCGR